MKNIYNSKVNLGFGLGLILTLFTGVLSYQSTVKFREVANLVSNTNEVLSELKSTEAAIQGIVTGERGFALTGKANFLESYYTGLKSLPESLEHARHLTQDNPSQQSRLTELKSLIDAEIDFAKHVVELRETKGFKESAALVSSGKGKLIMTQAHILFDELENEERNLLSKRLMDQKTQAQLNTKIIFIATALAFLFVLFASVLVNLSVTKQQKSERAFREQSRLLKAILDSLGEGVVAADMKGNFILFNRMAEKLIGTGATKESPEAWSENYGVFHPETMKPFRTEELALIKAINGENTDEVEQIIKNAQRPEGISIVSTGRPLIDDQGRIQGGVVIVRDITEKKKTTEELKQLNSRLERNNNELLAVNKELEEFSHSVSHDLRAPLRSMTGFSSALMEEYAQRLDETGMDYLTRIQNSSKKMGQLIDGLLSLSRLSRGEIIKEKVDLTKLANEIITDLKQTQPQRKFHCSIAPGLTVNGDSRLLQAALANLLSNAWKFTSKKPEAQIEFGMINKDGLPTYFVRDNGAGFDMRYRDQLFGTFHRLHSEKDFEGTGIGLATVQRIIQRHGGHIWAESKIDMGTTFYFTI